MLAGTLVVFYNEGRQVGKVGPCDTTPVSSTKISVWSDRVLKLYARQNIRIGIVASHGLGRDVVSISIESYVISQKIRLRSLEAEPGLYTRSAEGYRIHGVARIYAFVRVVVIGIRTPARSIYV